MLINLLVSIAFIVIFFNPDVLAEKPKTQQKELSIVATIKPFYNLTAAIIHNTNNRPVLLLHGNASPHDYALKLSDVEVIKKADLIIWGGEHLEFFLAKLFSKPELTNKILTIESLDKINKLLCRNSKQLDDHWWLSPDNAKVIVENIVDKLIELDPINTNRYLTNKKQFLTKLYKTNIGVKNKLSKIKNQSYLVFHDAYQYFEKFYGLKQPLVISENPEMPLSMRRMLVIHDAINKQQVKCLFREPQFNNKILDYLLKPNNNTENNLREGELDPLGLDQDLGADGYFKLLNNLADGLYNCLIN